MPPHRDSDQYPWRAPARWPTWGDRRISGVETSFDHLRPFDMQLVRAARRDLPEMRIDVVFDCHVVTEGHDEARHDFEVDSPHVWLDAGNRLRVFHSLRFQLSKDLPTLIRGLLDGKTKCYGTTRKNYMVWKPQGAGLDGSHYQVFFDMYRTNGPMPRLMMYVQSAYLKDRPLRTQRENTLVFATLCASLMGLIPAKTAKHRAKQRRHCKSKSPA